MTHTPATLAAAIRKVPLEERLHKCQQIVGALCAEGRCPNMRIPVTPQDEDVVLGHTLEDAATLVVLLREYFQLGLTSPEIDRTFELTTQLRTLIGLENAMDEKDKHVQTLLTALSAGELSAAQVRDLLPGNVSYKTSIIERAERRGLVEWVREGVGLVITDAGRGALKPQLSAEQVYDSRKENK
jgi:hypothetical protein